MFCWNPRGIQISIKFQIDFKNLIQFFVSNGICGTDLHLWKKGFAADFVVEKPMVLGHEPSALVIDVGSKVKNVKIGDRVAVEPIIPCWTCEYCRNGRYNLCPISFKQSRGLPPMDGCIRKYYTHPSGCCFKYSITC